MTEAIPQQFVTDEGELPTGEVTEQPGVEPGTPAQTETTTGGRRGRPRSQTAMDRDQRVLDTLTNEVHLTRNEIAEKVGFTGGLTYLSLYRLKRDGLVTRVADGTTRRAWRQTTPADVQAATDASVVQEPSVEQPAEG